MRFDSDDSSTRACASQILKALPRRLRPPSMKSRSTAWYVQHEIPGATHRPAPRHRITAHDDVPRGSEQWPPPDDLSLPTGSPPNPNCPEPSEERRQDNQSGCRRPATHAKIYTVLTLSELLPDAMIVPSVPERSSPTTTSSRETWWNT